MGSEPSKTRSCTLGDKTSDDFLERLLKAGMDEMSAVGAILEARHICTSTSNRDFQDVLLTTAAFGMTRSELAKAEAEKTVSLREKTTETVWVECQDASTGDWLPVNKPVTVTATRLYWVCTGDDCLLGDRHCTFIDQTQHHMSKAAWQRLRKARAESFGVGKSSKCLDSWWDSMFEKLSGGSMDSSAPQPTPRRKRKMSTPDCKSKPQPTRGDADKETVRRRRIPSSLQPIVENTDELHAWVVEHGILPWHKGTDARERRLGTWVKRVTDMACKGSLDLALKERLVTLFPSWDLGKAQRNAPAEMTAAVSEPHRDESNNSACSQDGCESAAARDLENRIWVRRTVMSLNMQVAQCRTVAERRQQIRRMQLEYHPDKNRGEDAEKVAHIFEFVQNLWKEHCKTSG